MQVIVDSLLIHYERAGSGPIVLILPGWADTAASWLTIKKSLSTSYDVIVLDIPGFGGSQQPRSPWNLDDYSRFVAHFVSKLDIKKVYAVIGHSNGGAMAIRTLGTSRLEATKLVLIASAGIRAVQQGRKGVLRIVAKTGRALAKPLPKSVQTKLRGRLYSSLGSDMLVAEHMQETFKNIVGDDVQDDAARVQIPTLLIYGDQDDQTPVRFGEMLHKLIAHSNLEIVPGADHFIHVGMPDEISRKVQKFLQ